MSKTLVIENTYTLAIKKYELNIIIKIEKDYRINWIKCMKDIKIFLKKKKKIFDNMVVSFTNISQNMNKQKLVEYRKKFYRMNKNALL